MNGPLLVKDIGASYAGPDQLTEVFRSVSFQVNPGEVLGLFGHNGCGKSTLLSEVHWLAMLR
jgi:ABC-type dipeptide/oligopeptide/nickel transport system ATPase subunit